MAALSAAFATSSPAPPEINCKTAVNPLINPINGAIAIFPINSAADFSAGKCGSMKSTTLSITGPISLKRFWIASPRGLNSSSKNPIIFPKMSFRVLKKSPTIGPRNLPAFLPKKPPRALPIIPPSGPAILFPSIARP